MSWRNHRFLIKKKTILLLFVKENCAFIHCNRHFGVCFLIRHLQALFQHQIKRNGQSQMDYQSLFISSKSNRNENLKVGKQQIQQTFHFQIPSRSSVQDGVLPNLWKQAQFSYFEIASWTIWLFGKAKNKKTTFNPEDTEYQILNFVISY